MIDIFVQLFLALNKVLFNNLGLTIIVIGALSRVIFYPFFAHTIRYSQTMRDLKPKLDDIKKRHGSDMRKLASEQSRVFKEAGVSPASGAIGCLSVIVQIGIFFLLFQTITRVIGSGIGTQFFLWDLARPDAYAVTGLPIAVPGVLVVTTAAAAFLQSKMMAPADSSKSKPSKEKTGFAEALAASQSQMAFIIPIVILISGTHFAAGLALYWLVSTILGIIQQYFIGGTGGLGSWRTRQTSKK